MRRNLVTALIVMLFCCQCSQQPADEDIVAKALSIPYRFEQSAEPISAIATEQDLPVAVVNLGRDLYHDTRLSGGQNVSCATCHPVDGAGMTVHDSSASGSTSYYDVPTIFNTADQFAFFWNGRSQSLESVIQVSLQAENIMNSAWNVVLPMLNADPEYAQKFDLAYPDRGLDQESVIDALEIYIHSLATPNAAFDRWLNGENLSESALAGYELFKDYGCIRCHQGAGVGGNIFASFRTYLETRENPRTTDFGRFNVTNDEAHRYQFKVPSLRNVTVTAPYFHDGSAETLSEAVDIMARYQLGRSLPKNEISQIISFLDSLTGWREGELLGSTQ